MTQLFEVTYEDINQLSDSQLTDLLRRLLHLEASRCRIAASGVDVALNIRVSDGGEDGRIKWVDGPSHTDYVPNRLTLFQCKAQVMLPAACAKELQRKDSVELKPQIESVLDAEGSYILFTTQALNGQLIAQRIKKMREAIRDAGKNYADTADLHIYDANKIRDWTNRYVPAVAAVCRWRGRPLLPGMQTWEYWSGQAEYQRFPFVPSDISDGYITQLRDALTQPRGIARIVGLSGLGKTRLALETFRPSSENNVFVEDLHHRVVYLDVALDIPYLAATVSDWCSHGLEGILVVDNCDLELHQQLEAQITHSESQLSLLTLDYNPDIVSDTPTIRLEQAPDSLIKEMLKQVYKSFPDVELDRIARYAQGFPRMAVMLAQARLNEDADIGYLKDDTLVKRLLWGSKQGDEQAEKVISACALFEYIGYTENREEEYVFVAEHVCNIDPNDFYRHVQNFKQRGIVDMRGRYIRVVPLPLAVRLAADWWRRCSPPRACELITMDMPGKLSEALCDRVAKLDFLPEARELVRDLCGEVGPFGQAEVLNSERGSRLFRSLAEVNPKVTAQTLERIFGGWSREDLLHVGPGRRNLIWTLEKLCFRRETFPTAARLLLAFAAAENENWSNNATGIFQQLFHVYLSGTQAPPEERLPIIEEALVSSDPYRQKLAVEALGHALQTHHFSRSGGAESQGSGPPLEDWRPHIWEELFDYWNKALKRLTKVALGRDELSGQAKSNIANSIRGLVTYGRMDDLEQAINSVVEQHGSYWPDALSQIRQTIHYEGQKIPQEGRERLHRWLNLVEPVSIPDRLRIIVSAPPWGDVQRDDDGHYINMAEERAKKLAEECADDLSEWLEHLPIIFQKEQRQAYAFGLRLGQCLEDSHAFIDAAVAVLADLPKGKANPIALATFLKGVKPRSPEIVQRTLDTVAADDILCSYLIELTRLTEPTLSDLERILGLVQSGRISAAELDAFTYGSVLKHLPPDDLYTFIDGLLAHGIEGAWTALEILFMYQHNDTDHWAACKSQFRKLLMHPDLTLVGQREATELSMHQWKEVANKLLAENDLSLAKDLAEKILAVCASKRSYVEFDHALEPVLRSLLEHYRETVWPLFSVALLSDEWHMIHRLTGLLGSRMENEQKPGVLFILPGDFLLEWCELHKEKAAPVLARIMPLFQREGDHWAWGPFARAIIDRYGAQDEVLSEISANLITYSWVGSQVPYYTMQIQPFEQLRHHPIPNVRRWAGEQLRNVQKQRERESALDAERNIGISWI